MIHVIPRQSVVYTSYRASNSQTHRVHCRRTQGRVDPLILVPLLGFDEYYVRLGGMATCPLLAVSAIYSEVGTDGHFDRYGAVSRPYPWQMSYSRLSNNPFCWSHKTATLPLATPAVVPE